MTYTYPYTKKVNKRSRAVMIDFIRSFPRRTFGYHSYFALNVKFHHLGLTAAQEEAFWETQYLDFHPAYHVVGQAIDTWNRTNGRIHVYTEGRSGGWLVLDIKGGSIDETYGGTISTATTRPGTSRTCVPSPPGWRSSWRSRMSCAICS